MTKEKVAEEYAKKVATNKDLQRMAAQDFLEGVKWAEEQFTNETMTGILRGEIANRRVFIRFIPYKS